MKTLKSFIVLIGILFLFNSSVTGGSLMGDEPKNPVITEVIYTETLQEFTLIHKIMNGAKRIFPEAFEEVKIIIEFGSEVVDQPLEREDWMSKPFSVEEEIKTEIWMTEPLKIS